MSYETDFSLKIHNPRKKTDEIYQYISDNEGEEDNWFGWLQNNTNTPSYDTNFKESEIKEGDLLFTTENRITWYECNIDLVEFSKKFPKVLFELRGNGSTFPDVWVTFFKGGKYSKELEAEIKYPKFEKSYLIEYEGV